MCNLCWMQHGFTSSHLFSFLFIPLHSSPVIPILLSSSSPEKIFISIYSLILYYFIFLYHILLLSSSGRVPLLLLHNSLLHNSFITFLFFSRSLPNIPSGIYSYLWNIFLLLAYILTSGIYSFSWNIFFLLEYIISSSEICYRIIPYKIRKKCRTIFHGTICFH